MKLFSAMTRALARMFGPSNKPQTSRSSLVGLYLNQANNKDGFSSELQQSRQRRNGKYSHNRERA
ncbi:MAG: hypothetical protein ACO1QB_00520 [Verrucomicrobiales bacterium]